MAHNFFPDIEVDGEIAPKINEYVELRADEILHRANHGLVGLKAFASNTAEVIIGRYDLDVADGHETAVAMLAAYPKTDPAWKPKSDRDRVEIIMHKIMRKIAHAIYAKTYLTGFVHPENQPDNLEAEISRVLQEEIPYFGAF